MKKKSRFYAYYQPNDKDLKDQYGDCTIRALSKALGVSWAEAFDLMMPLCREAQLTNLFNAPSYMRKDFFKPLGLEWHGLSSKAGTNRPTVEEFAKDHPDGTYICSVAHHVVAVVDGKYYDTWDSGYKSLYGYYEKI